MKPMHSIKAVSRRTGLSAYLIRAWEKRYKAISPERTDSNRRLYSDQDIEKLILLREATLNGESIGQVARLSIEELTSLIGTESKSPGGAANEISSIPATVDGVIESAVDKIKSMDRGGLYRILLDSSSRFSKPVLLENIIIPLLHKIGDMWENGSMKVASEHLASAVLRSFLGELIISYRVPETRPSIIVTTPSGQVHEFGAIVATLTALSEGWRSVYLGPDLPADEIAHSVRQYGSKIIALSIVYPAGDSFLGVELANIRRLVGDDVSIFVGGRSARSYDTHFRAIEAVVISSMAEFRNTLRYDESNNHQI